MRKREKNKIILRRNPTELFIPFRPPLLCIISSCFTFSPGDRLDFARLKWAFVPLTTLESAPWLLLSLIFFQFGIVKLFRFEKNWWKTFPWLNYCLLRPLTLGTFSPASRHHPAVHWASKLPANSQMWLQTASLFLGHHNRYLAQSICFPPHFSSNSHRDINRLRRGKFAFAHYLLNENENANTALAGLCSLSEPIYGLFERNNDFVLFLKFACCKEET